MMIERVYLSFTCICSNGMNFTIPIKSKNGRKGHFLREKVARDKLVRRQVLLGQKSEQILIFV